MEFTSENILLVLSVMIFISIAAGKAGFKYGIPGLLVFLAVGMAMGSDGIGYAYDNYPQAQFIGMVALCVILFSGGMNTRYSDIKPVWKEGVVLATLGVLFTAIFTGIFIYAISDWFGLKLTFAQALLLASVMSSTDSASVFSILRSKGLNLSQNLRPTLELESGSNDPMAFMLTITLIEYIQAETVNFSIIANFFAQIALGALGGIFLGKLAYWAMRKINLEIASLYSVFLVSCVLFIFSITDKLGGNGYLAVYLAGLVVGNNPIPQKRNTRGFFDTFAWLWQILMFLTLGLLVNPKNLLPVAVLGMIIGIFMILLGRPLSVFLCLIPFKKITQKARLYISWVGLRGAVPIIFATYPVVREIPNAQDMFDIVFFITILSLVIQGTSVPYVARKLGLAADNPGDSSEFGIELPDEVKSVISEISVDKNTLLSGNTLRTLNLPEHTLVVFVKRADKFFIPRGNTTLSSGDKLLVMSDNPAELEKVYRKLGVSKFNFQ